MNYYRLFTETQEKIEINPSHPVSLITMKGLGYKLIVEGK